MYCRAVFAPYASNDVDVNKKSRNCFSRATRISLIRAKIRRKHADDTSPPTSVKKREKPDTRHENMRPNFITPRTYQQHQPNCSAAANIMMSILLDIRVLCIVLHIRCKRAAIIGRISSIIQCAKMFFATRQRQRQRRRAPYHWRKRARALLQLAAVHK